MTFFITCITISFFSYTMMEMCFGDHGIFRSRK
jgi:hypothetical protein